MMNNHLSFFMFRHDEEREIMDLKRQASAPLYEAIETFRKKRIVPFDVPGHKRGRGNPELVDLLGERCVGIDVNSMKPLDNLYRFVRPGELLLAWTDENDPQYVRSHMAYEILSSQKDAKGSPIKIHKLPIPHIPDDHFYQEKFYFTPGDSGFKVFDTRFGCIGVGICWDQWFPETVRCMAVQGAEMLLYPTAIGSEPVLDVDSSSHWRRVMQGRAAANLMPVVAANRIEVETVEPCKENAGQSSSLDFYGCSFIADATGDIIASAKQEETILYGEFDLDALKEDRLSWGLFRDRRPETYVVITKK